MIFESLELAAKLEAFVSSARFDLVRRSVALSPGTDQRIKASRVTALHKEYNTE
jgi:hypothetical protein